MAADHPPARVYIDPPISDWRVTPRHGRAAPIIATGHQPTFWHPGILAKDFAVDVFAERVGGSTLHVVVEHSPLGSSGLDLPLIKEGRIRVERKLIFGNDEDGSLPPNRLGLKTRHHPKIDELREQLYRYTLQIYRPAGQARKSLQLMAPIIDAFNKAHLKGNFPHRAAFITTVLDQLKRPYLSQQMSYLPSSEMITQNFLDRLVADPVGCVRSYNRAAIAYPEARIRPLYLGRDVVEAPLWAQDATTCTPVYIDLGDSKCPQLFTTEHNAHLDLKGSEAIKHLRPRAVTLSAIMRSERCDLFIHGTGGGIYDQVTERWWQDWVGEDLAPKAVVSADVYLPFDVPTATRDELRHAVWFDHHLKFNVDRHTTPQDDAESALIAEKRGLLDRMDDDRDKRRRAKAFKRIHAINAQLRGEHEAALHNAARRVSDTRLGVKNAAVADRRDWCFALYPQPILHGLRDQIGL